MKVWQILQLTEGYKEATAEFSGEADKEAVSSAIDTYKELVKRNQVLGDERNIDYWRKQGWDKFAKFVSTKSTKPSITQVKRKKIPGNSIVLEETDEWLIVIPLDKDASCFHGKNSNWCTTKTDQMQFEQYFYRNNIVLIYCLNKKNAGMWAIAAHTQIDKIELFDQRDELLTAGEFMKQTGLNSTQLAKKAMSEHKPAIDGSREKYKALIGRQKELISQVEVGKRNEPLEELLLKTRNADACTTYIRKVGVNDGYPIAIQLLALKYDPDSMQFFKNSSEKVQLIAVNGFGSTVKFIDNPSEKVQIAAVNNGGPQVIQYIKNPSEEAQLAAINKDEDTLKYIKNPTPKVLALVKQLKGKK